MTPWNNPRDINFNSTPQQDLDPDSCIRELTRQYHIQHVDTQPRYVHMAMDLPVNYSAATATDMAKLYTHTDTMITLRMPLSSYEALAVRHRRDHMPKGYDMHTLKDERLEQELYLRRSSSAVRRAYEQYRITLQLAWEHKAEDQ